jgi:hypothetical protein
MKKLTIAAAIVLVIGFIAIGHIDLVATIKHLHGG